MSGVIKYNNKFYGLTLFINGLHNLVFIRVLHKPITLFLNRLVIQGRHHHIPSRPNQVFHLVGSSLALRITIGCKSRNKYSSRAQLIEQ